jgi:hypothetical protein
MPGAAKPPPDVFTGGNRESGEDERRNIRPPVFFVFSCNASGGSIVALA